MKRKINILLIGIFCIGLSGCYESVVRFWNNDGWEPPPAKKKAKKECFEELESIPEPQNKSPGSKEMQDWLGKVYGPAERECMKRKGF
ncbi:MAG: hypothetical protein J6578_10265 [Snodgrassella sp.]|uniref:hypothetical protein n=1 Tax=Snodgrassella TaxID=1193515 RepID=UPI000560AD10|nr:MULTISPECIES: hypothetical protein [Snodgrassella]MCO6509150.1 hypothetical protein [Snodgrassella sp.]